MPSDRSSISRSRVFLPLVVVVISTLFLSACQGDKPFSMEQSLHHLVDGSKAFSHVKALVEIGPRPAGSEGIEQARLYLEQELAAAGWSTQRQTFSASTPEGAVEFVNLRARWGEAPQWAASVRGLLSSHYDSKFYRGFEFVGANDSGSSTGLLLELARVLATQPAIAGKVELVFFDGEEAFGPNITPKDGLYGSKHYAAEWAKLPEKQRPRWGVLLDMVGDEELKIRAAVHIPRASLQELAASQNSGYQIDFQKVESRLQAMSGELLSAASDLGYRSQVGISSNYIIDDHIPLNVSAGIPTINLIDFDYPYWHTPADTLDKVKPSSLQITGRVTLLLVEKYLLPQ